MRLVVHQEVINAFKLFKHPSLNSGVICTYTPDLADTSAKMIVKITILVSNDLIYSCPPSVITEIKTTAIF